MAVYRTSRTQLLLAMSLAFGCNDSAVPSGSAGSGTGSADSTTGEPVDLCMSAADPSIYGASVWSPTPLVGTPECPALDGPIVIDLHTVTIDGVVQSQGEPTKVAWVQLVGRGDEGTVRVLVDEDGTFSADVLAGHYDIRVAHAEDAHLQWSRLTVENADFTASTTLTVQTPPLVTVTGLMTLDGEPAPDPTAHIFVRVAGEFVSDPYMLPPVARMDQGTYSVRLPPGTYDFGYTACEPDIESFIHIGPNLCYDPDVVLSRPFDSPQQRLVLVSTGVVVDSDMQLDIDVPTVRFSGTLEINDAYSDPHSSPTGLSVRNDVGVGSGSGLSPREEFDVRVVEGTYRLDASDAPPIVDALVLDEDQHMDVFLDSHTLNIAFEPPPPTGEAPLESDPLLFITTPWRAVDWQFHSPQEATQEVFSDHFSIDVEAQYCWPDYPWEVPVSRTMLHDDLLIDNPLDLYVSTPQLARVELEYADFGEPGSRVIELLPVHGSEPGMHALEFRPEDPSFVAHGVVPAGTYQIGDEQVEIVDGTSIRLVRDSQRVEFDLRADGQPVDADKQLKLDGHYRSVDSGDVPPGRYPIVFSSAWDAPIAQNHDAVVGCVTVEG